MEELKPCPFCGSSDVCFHYTSGRCRGNHMGFMIKCKKCGGAGELFYSRAGNPVNEAEGQAVKAWNTRAERTCEFVASETFDEWEIVCTACKSRLDWTISGSNYCPECGAKVEYLDDSMDGVAE